MVRVIGMEDEATNMPPSLVVKDVLPGLILYSSSSTVEPDRLWIAQVDRKDEVGILTFMVSS